MKGERESESERAPGGTPDFTRYVCERERGDGERARERGDGARERERER